MKLRLTVRGLPLSAVVLCYSPRVMNTQRDVTGISVDVDSWHRVSAVSASHIPAEGADTSAASQPV